MNIYMNTILYHAQNFLTLIYMYIHTYIKVILSYNNFYFKNTNFSLNVGLIMQTIIRTCDLLTS